MRTIEEFLFAALLDRAREVLSLRRARALSWHYWEKGLGEMMEEEDEY
jgi:hypothetical protein